MSGAGPETDERIEREREWHDERFEGGDSRKLGILYEINRAGHRWYKDAIDRLADDALLLDYGCGDHAYCAMHAAERGLRAKAIDLSPAAVETARKVAAEHGLDHLIDFDVGNAEDLPYEDDTFDCVAGLGVIHHLDVDASMAEISRVLKPDGRADFMEAMGHNPAINAFRRATPSQRTEDEHPLRVEDLETMGKYFGQVDAQYLHLLTLAAIPAIGRSRFEGMVARLERADQALFRRVPALKKHAWMVCVELSSPR